MRASKLDVLLESKMKYSKKEFKKTKIGRRCFYFRYLLTNDQFLELELSCFTLLVQWLNRSSTLILKSFRFCKWLDALQQPFNIACEKCKSMFLRTGKVIQVVRVNAVRTVIKVLILYDKLSEMSMYKMLWLMMDLTGHWEAQSVKWSK